MNYNKINTYHEFIQYVLKRLGAPVININVSDDQLIDRVSDAIQYYIEEHYDSTKEFYWLYKITQEDINRGYVLVSPDVIDVIDITTKTTSANYDMDDLLDDPQYNFFMNYWNYGGAALGGLTFYEMTMQELSLINRILNANVQFVWRTREKQLFLYKEMKVDNVICIRGYKVLDPETSLSIWDSRWLKEYATALVGMQFATNLSKFGNIPSSGGATIDATGLLQRYTEEKRKLEDEFQQKYQYPVSFFIA